MNGNGKTMIPHSGARAAETRRPQVISKVQKREDSNFRRSSDSL